MLENVIKAVNLLGRYAEIILVGIGVFFVLNLLGKTLHSYLNSIPEVNKEDA